MRDQGRKKARERSTGQGRERRREQAHEERDENRSLAPPPVENWSWSAADILLETAIEEPAVAHAYETAMEAWRQERARLGPGRPRAAPRDPRVKEIAQRAFLAAFEVFGTIRRAALRTGLEPIWIYEWAAKDTEFRTLLRVAELTVADRLFERDLARALSPHAEMDAASAAISHRLLKALRPLQFRDNAPFAQPAIPTTSIDIGEGNANPYAGLVAQDLPHTNVRPSLAAPSPASSTTPASSTAPSLSPSPSSPPPNEPPCALRPPTRPRPP